MVRPEKRAINTPNYPCSASAASSSPAPCASLHRRLLRRDSIRVIGQIVHRMDRIPGGVDDARRYKNNQVLLLSLAGFAAEQPAQKGQVTKHRYLVLVFCYIFGEQPAEHDGLTDHNVATCHHLP